jgi:hypothetical protein
MAHSSPEPSAGLLGEGLVWRGGLWGRNPVGIGGGWGGVRGEAGTGAGLSCGGFGNVVTGKMPVPLCELRGMGYLDSGVGWEKVGGRSSGWGCLAR